MSPEQGGRRSGGTSRASARRVLLSPIQTATYGMARVLLVCDAWDELHSAPIDLERAMLIDFAAEFPRSMTKVVPDVAAVIRAYGLEAGDLSDLFAHRRLEARRERFLSVLVDLQARDLVQESHAKIDALAVSIVITELGRATASRFTSALSASLRAISRVYCREWHRRKVTDLLAEVRRALPDAAEDIAHLTAPFTPWEEEARHLV